MNSNSFEDIILDDVEHIVFGLSSIGEVAERRVRGEQFLKKTFFNHLVDILSHTFTKKYNLIYPNETLDWGIEDNIETSKKENTDIMERILQNNPDKFFMIINNDTLVSLDAFSLRQHSNCQVWPRKYFNTSLFLSHKGSRDYSVIQKNRQHWFCSILGRSDYFRTNMFNWIMDQGLEKQNKISYLCYAIKTRNISLNNDQQDNFITTGGKKEYKGMIPYNNFEGKNNIPVDDPERINKAMPIYDCLFNIVVETFATYGYAFHSEKSLNTILYGHIPILLGGAGTMNKFQNMGIIIPDYIQWSIWDDIPMDSINYNKMDIMKRQLKELFAKHKINDIAMDWYPYAVRNFKKFINLKSECAREEKEICRWILTATHNLSNPKYQYLYDANARG